MADTLLMRKIYNAISPSSVIEEAYQGNLPFFDELMQFATNKNPANQWGTTPLHWAARYGRVDICRLLLDHVENKHPRNNDGETPLALAQKRGHGAVVELFAEN